MTPASAAIFIEGGAGLSPERRRIVGRCLSVLGALSTCAMIGVAFSLYLVNHQPLLLIALSPLGRHLVLVTGGRTLHLRRDPKRLARILAARIEDP